MTRPYALLPIEALRDPRLNASHKMLYVALQSCSNSDGITFPSLAALAKLTGYNQHAVVVGIGHLVKAGWLERVESYLVDGKQPKANVYRLHSIPRTVSERSPVRDYSQGARQDG